ncbi:MAG: SDR family oxidoreductase [Emcibacter sp.]|nr:SDR family oxidoreductase [Emcibacter sp.]
MAERLAGKIIVVTGASRGLGRHCAMGYGAEGATVIVVARSKVKSEGQSGTIDETVSLIEEAGGSAFPVVCDVADPDSIQSMVRTVLDKFGRIDVLMTNAVFYAPGTISTMDLSDWEFQFKVNVHGVFHAIRAVLPSMIDNRSGNIITISSIAAKKASHYSATKSAVESTTNAFAAEQKCNGIAVNSLRPVAGIETPGWLNARDAKSRQARAHRLSPPDSYVEAAILLAMQTPEDCTGQHLTDADVLKRFVGEDVFEHFKAMNAPVWAQESRGMEEREK